MDSAMQLTGIHHLTAISTKPRENLAFYTGLLGMRLVKKTVNQDNVSAYHLFYADGKANPGTDLTFFDFPAAPERRGTNSISRTGLRVAGGETLGFWRYRLKQAGGVDHLAFRTPDEAQYHAWTQRLTDLRVPNSGEIDRFYFRSLYFREPNGILFEIATDGPGFATDEPLAALGEKLALPPFLEPRRKEIEAGLKPLG